MNKSNGSLISKKELEAIKIIVPKANYIAWDADGIAYVFEDRPSWDNGISSWLIDDTTASDYYDKIAFLKDRVKGPENAQHVLFDITQARCIAPKYLSAEEVAALRKIFPWAKGVVRDVLTNIRVYEVEPVIKDKAVHYMGGQIGRAHV